jgi:hypothetical protein
MKAAGRLTMPKTKSGDDVRDERLQVMLKAEELRALDDFRFKARMPSRAAAIREILRRGLIADGFELAAEGARSGQFGVMTDDSGS